MNILQRSPAASRASSRVADSIGDDALRVGHTMNPRRASLPSAAGDSLEAAQNTGVSPIFELQPEVLLPPAWFTVIPIPASVASLSTGQSFGYLLRRVNVSGSTEMTLALIRAYLKAPNWVPGSGYGIAAGSCAAWGAITEPAAWIVVGRNLSLNVDANGASVWTPIIADCPGIEQNVGMSALTTPPAANPAEYAARIPFPSGSWSDTAGAPTLPLAIPFGVGQYPIKQRSSLDVALIVRGAQVTAGAGKSIVGLAYIELVCNTINSMNAVTGQRAG